MARSGSAVVRGGCALRARCFVNTLQQFTVEMVSFCQQKCVNLQTMGTFLCAYCRLWQFPLGAMLLFVIKPNQVAVTSCSFFMKCGFLMRRNTCWGTWKSHFLTFFYGSVTFNFPFYLLGRVIYVRAVAEVETQHPNS